MHRSLEVLKHLTAGWPGEKLGDEGIARLINPSGTRKLLIWCVNAEFELPLLADALGPDQPLVGLRSLHMIVPTGPRRYQPDQELAEYYTRVLLSHPEIDLDNCTLAGNCVGSAIALRIADNLLSQGRPAQVLATMEAQSWLPYPGRVYHLFADRSHQFNPFLRGDDPYPMWNTLFSDPLVAITPGEHGKIITVENIQCFVNSVRAMLDVPLTERSAAPAARSLAPEFHGVPAYASAGGSIDIELRAVDARSDGAHDLDALCLYSVWQSAEHGIWCSYGRQQVLPRARHDLSKDIITIPAPKGPGRWKMELFVCSRQHGPVGWQTTVDRSFDIEVR